MFLNELHSKDLPFPYFLLDDTLNILQTSNVISEELLDKSFTELIEPTNVPYFKDFLKNTNEQASIDLPISLSDGDMQNFRIYCSQIDNKFVHLFCYPIEKQDEMAYRNDFSPFAQVVSKKNITYIDQNNESKKAAAYIAHEIKNPLTTVKGFIQLLKPHLKELGKEFYAEVAIDELNRVNDMLYDFLSDSRSKHTETQYAQLNDILEKMIVVYGSEAALKKINITTDLCEAKVDVSINPKQLKQVLANIIKNAIEAITECNPPSPHWGEIHIKSEVQDSFAIVTIEDDGNGMNEETLSNLFTPFYTTKEAGTGIGLTLSKKIVEDNGGSLQVLSRYKSGTTFTITLPKLNPYKNLKRA